MKNSKIKTLNKNGWKVGNAKDLLNLTEEEVRLLETKRALIKLLKQVRTNNNITQEKLALMIHSSQSRIAKIEASSTDVSIDLIFKALFALGVSQAKLARAIAEARHQ